MNPEDLFVDNIKNKKLFLPGDILLLAVSGGMDSVVLCELCKRAGFDFSIAHCNFQLRGPESKRDEDFVRNLALHYSVGFHFKVFDTEAYANQKKVSMQVAARELRYDWFNLLIESNKIQWLLTAHHADDNIETVLMNFFKGSGITGLRGIQEKSGRIIRPLLHIRKTALMLYAKDRGLNWVEDSSNLSDKYSRNYFRNKVIPLVSQIYPEAESNLLDNIERFEEVALVYEQAMEGYRRILLEQKGNEFHIPVLKLAKQKPLNSIVYEILKKFDFSPAQSKEVIKLLKSESGKFVQSSTYQIIRHRKWLVIVPKSLPDNSMKVVEKDDRFIDCGTFKLSIEKKGIETLIIDTATDIAYVDAGTVEFPLIVRRMKTGDYFYPLGMKKKKKLSRFLIDRKLSKSDKEKVWVVESNKRIVWVLGFRIDDRFKIKESSTASLVLSIQNK